MSGRRGLLPVVSEPLAELPVLVLEPHSQCNCRCLMCEIWQATTTAQLSVADLSAWLVELRELGVQQVLLSGGEPLLHRQLPEFLALLRAAGLRTMLLSTGLLLSKHAAAVAAGVDELIVSLDGPAAVHDAIRRVPRAFELLATGVAAVRAAGTLRIGGRCTVQQANYRYLRATVAAAHQVGLDWLSFLAVDTSSEAFNRPGGPSAQQATAVGLASGDLAPLAAELAALEQDNAVDFASGFVAESPAKLRRRLLDYFRAAAGQGEFAAESCNAPWVSAVVGADRQVRPCFFHPPYGRLEFGQSLRELLQSPTAQAWRDGLVVAENPICQRCVCTLAWRGER
ncbi:MAG: radical SAM protein [Fimbriimonadaceae bacterium]|nr:radical SAM protein [Fimbriimonadaceae bacterium]